MTITAGTIQYQLGTALACLPNANRWQITGCGLPVRVRTQTGFSYSADELDTALSGSVAGYIWEANCE